MSRLPRSASSSDMTSGFSVEMTVKNSNGSGTFQAAPVVEVIVLYPEDYASEFRAKAQLLSQEIRDLKIVSEDTKLGDSPVRCNSAQRQSLILSAFSFPLVEIDRVGAFMQAQSDLLATLMRRSLETLRTSTTEPARTLGQ